MNKLMHVKRTSFDIVTKTMLFVWEVACSKSRKDNLLQILNGKY